MSQDLKAKLTKLIKNSPTLKSLSPEEFKFRAGAMLSAEPKAQAEFVKILEQESAKLNQIDEAYVKEANDLITEAKALEAEAEGLFRKEKEDTEQSEKEKSADDILKMLDQI